MKLIFRWLKNDPIAPAIIIILLIGLLMRIGNPKYASPVLYAMSDEASNYMSALYMISQKTIISKAAVYPPLGAYILIPFLLIYFIFLIFTGKFESINELKYFLVTHEGFLLFIPRLISGIFGFLTIITVYLISKELFTKKNSVVFWATYFFAFSFNHIHVSHFNRPWAGLVFFYSLTILFSLKCITQNKNKYRNYILSGLFAGLSFGFHYAGLFAILIFLFSVLPLNLTNAIKELKKPQVIHSVLIFFLITLLTYSLIQKKASPDFFAPAIAFYNNEGILILIFNLIKGISVFGLLQQIFVIDPVITVLGICALFLKKIWKYPFTGLTLYCLTYLLVSSIFIHTSARYIMPLMIIFSIYGGYIFSLAISKISSGLLKTLLVMFILLLTTVNPILWNYLYFKEPTFIQMRHWLDQNIDPNIPIASNSYRMIGYSPAIEPIKVVQKYTPNYYNELYSILNDKLYTNTDNIRNIYYLEQLGKLDPISINQAIDEYKIRYFIDMYWDPINKLDPILDSKKYKLIKKFHPVKNGDVEISIYNLTFHILNEKNNSFLFFIDKPGPYIDIYQIY